MARRGSSKRAVTRHVHDDRPFNLGTHWRADGEPKSSFSSQAEAWAAADERRREAGVDLQVYQCDICTSWHMGRPRQRDR